MSHLVLLIDDDRRLTTALEMRLRFHGYRVLTANSGEHGLKAARESRPHLIVLDIRMPGMDGFEVCRQIRSDSDLQSTPILVVSAIESDSARRAVIEAGASQFLPKPYEAADVLAAIAALISRSHAPDCPTSMIGPSASSLLSGELPI